MRFRSSALDQIAAMICGDAELPFPYRTGNDIGRFFSGLGVESEAQAGKSRNPWCRESLEAINNQSRKDGDLPSPDMRCIVEELMNRIYFEKSQKETIDYEEALTRINRVLKQYALEIVPDEKTGKASLHSVDGSFVSTAIDATEAIRKITFCPTVFQVPKDLEVQPDLVAVMMPFLAEFDPVIAAVRTACKSKDLRCKRADDMWKNSPIIQDIFEFFCVSFVVVVDFSGRNGNVMYETGIAHILGKHVVPIT
jgi:hypothetical protein